jgi:hypothetical protein
MPRRRKSGMESRGRWASWEVAFNHIDEAIQQGFYIEALALEERIMADQLGLAGKGVEKKGPEFAQVDAWRKERNRFVRNVAHGLPGRAPTVTAEEYNARGRKAAETGVELARAICDWGRSDGGGRGDKSGFHGVKIGRVWCFGSLAGGENDGSPCGSRRASGRIFRIEP